MPTTSEGQTCHIRCQASGGCCAQLHNHCGPAGPPRSRVQMRGIQNIPPLPSCPRLRGVLRESGAVVPAREVEVPGWQRADGTRARLDVAFAWAGRECYADVTIRHPCAVKYVRQAGAQDGATLRLAEAGNLSGRTTLLSPPRGWMRSSPSLLRQSAGSGRTRCACSGRRQQAAEQQAPYARWAGPALHQKWLASLSCSLQQTLYEASRARAIAPPEADLSGFGR